MLLQACNFNNACMSTLIKSEPYIKGKTHKYMLKTRHDENIYVIFELDISESSQKTNFVIIYRKVEILANQKWIKHCAFCDNLIGWLSPISISKATCDLHINGLFVTAQTEESLISISRITLFSLTYNHAKSTGFCQITKVKQQRTCSVLKWMTTKE